MKKGLYIYIFFLTIVGFLSFNVSRVEAASFYYTAAVDTDWNTLGNWWNDAVHTIPAVSLPGPSDDVVIEQNGVDTNTGLTAPTVRSLFVNGWYISIPITVTTTATFESGTLYSDLIGDAVFNGAGYVYDGASVIGDVIFNDTSENQGTITGDVIFNDSSKNRRIFSGFPFPPPVNGEVIGNATFNDLSVNQALVTGNAIFNNSTKINQNVSPATVTGDAIFNNLSFGTGTIGGNAIFNDFSINDGTVNLDAIFNDQSYNADSVIGNATFNDYGSTSNLSVVSGNASFFDSTQNGAGATITGDACFATTATNSGTVGGAISVCSISAPSVSTTTSNSINSVSSVLFGLITDTGGESVTAGVEYGLDNTYGSSVLNPGNFNLGTLISGAFGAIASSLTCSTTYHFRAFATNSAGTDYGNDATFNTGSCLASPVLYGVDGSGQNPGAPHLFTINPATGAKITDVGAVGFGVTGLAFHPTTGILYGTTNSNDPTLPKGLITINTTTGAGTSLGTIRNAGNVATNMPDIDFDSNGTLYGWSGTGNDLYSIVLNSCDGGGDVSCFASEEGISSLSTYGNGLVFDNTDNLYLFGNGDDTYYQIDTDTAATISENYFFNGSGQGYSIGAATSNNDNVLFGARMNFGSTPSDLVIIDTDSNTILSTGDNADMQYMDAIAFFNPDPVASAVTTDVASSLTQTEATLNGTITDTGGAEPTERGFNWGLTDTYGTNVVQNSGPYNIGAFSSNLSGLTCGTTYHYRAYATNSVDTTLGLDTTFTTTACDAVSGGTTSGSRPKTTTAIVTPSNTVTVSVACPTGHLFSTTTGLPCTAWESNTTTPPSCVISTTLKQGSKGEQVKCLQTGLKILSDGIFGPMTKASVISFQKLHNLVPDGIFGPKSLAEWGK
jgi:hypothetical protein